MEPEDYRRLRDIIYQKETWTRDEVALELKPIVDQTFIDGLWDIKLPGIPRLGLVMSKQQVFYLIAITMDMTHDKALETDGRRLKCKLKELRRYL
jgi:hypothetical protein